MHISVCIKQTPDSASVYVDPISGQIDAERFVQVLNQADACAVEAAVRLREQHGGSVTVLTVGPADAEGALRAALALGANKALRLWNSEANNWGAFTVATALAATMQREAVTGVTPDIILCGDSSSDWSSGVVGPALADQLALSQVTGVAQLSVFQDHEQFVVRLTRKLERGYREILEADLPLLITVTGDMNEPRYPSMPAHLAALKTHNPVLDPAPFMNTAWYNEGDETTLLEMHTPRPRPKRLAAPDSKHSAYQRIGEIVSGGATGRKTRLVEGSPEELAQTLVDFLKARGFV